MGLTKHCIAKNKFRTIICPWSNIETISEVFQTSFVLTKILIQAIWQSMALEDQLKELPTKQKVYKPVSTNQVNYTPTTGLFDNSIQHLKLNVLSKTELSWFDNNILHQLIKILSSKITT